MLIIIELIVYSMNKPFSKHCETRAIFRFGNLNWNKLWHWCFSNTAHLWKCDCCHLYPDERQRSRLRAFKKWISGCCQTGCRLTQVWPQHDPNEWWEKSWSPSACSSLRTFIWWNWTIQQLVENGQGLWAFDNFTLTVDLRFKSKMTPCKCSAWISLKMTAVADIKMTF